ncbi:nickel ABC transporter permease subunit NikC [Helicobacter typhlonius]|uniref:nickel ABC transporter permease subunit NikC n=1 Tax=Helicobacter typhlonius TaxID=76936 RepID=UPI002FE31705
MRAMSWWGKCALVGMGIIALLAFFAPFVAPYAPDMQDLDNILAPASAAHWCGSDYLGRDIFSRILYGARLSLGCAAVILVFIVILGISVGGLSGFVGGRIDALCMRICDIFMSVPTIALSLFLIGVLGSGLENVMIAIILTHWAWYARIVRSIVFSLKNKEYVLLSFTFGAGSLQRFKRHLMLPIISQCAVLASMDIGHIMLHIAGLSFLGLGVQSPTAEWGIMLSEAKDYLWDYPMLIVYPGLALFVCVALANMIGESLRDSFGFAHKLEDFVSKNTQIIESVQIQSAKSLELEHLRIKSYENELVSVDSVRIYRGECSALLGKSGSGKSLSAFALQGFISPNLTQQDGSVRLDDKLINPALYRGVIFACIMQNPRTCFNPLLSINYHFKETCKALYKPYDSDFIRQCLLNAGLDSNILSAYPFELSGGMLQRVMIALALLTQAPFIIADEPTSDLDKPIAYEILRTLRDLKDSHNLGILLITHDLAAVADNATYVYVMEQGRIIESAQILQGKIMKEGAQTPTMRHLAQICAQRSENARA